MAHLPYVCRHRNLWIIEIVLSGSSNFLLLNSYYRSKEIYLYLPGCLVAPTIGYLDTFFALLHHINSVRI